MGLFQNLLETYEKCSAVVGIVQTDSNGNANEKKTLLPIFHMTFKSAICVTLDNQGKFIRATRDSKETTIIIPCTESSFGRSSNIAAHPLCDQLDYVGGINDDKTIAFLAELDSWKGNCELLNAIRIYVSGKTIIKDLSNNDIFKENEYQKTKDGFSKIPDFEKIRKIAAGGCAMIIIGDVPVGKSQFEKSLFDKKGFAYYQKLAEIVHSYNCRICAQLH